MQNPYSFKRIAVIGLGYIGQPLLGVLAGAGLEVVGIDIDPHKVAEVGQGRPTVHEPGLPELLQANLSRISTCCDYYPLAGVDAVFVTIGTPQVDDLYDIRPLFDVAASIGRYLRLQPDMLVVLRSTVPVSFTRRFADCLALHSGLDKDALNVAYCPERTVAGAAVAEMQAQPTIISGINTRSAYSAGALFTVINFRQPKVVFPVEAAELAKLVSNAWRATQITFANEVGAICEEYKVSADLVVEAVNEGYMRGGVLRPGLGPLGPCLVKDTRLLHSNEESPLFDAVLNLADAPTLRLALVVQGWLNRHADLLGRNRVSPLVVLAGLAFKGKPVTDDTRNAAGSRLLSLLQRSFPLLEVGFYDPLVKGFEGWCVSDDLDAFNGANVVVLLNELCALSSPGAFNRLRARAGWPLLIVDVWRQLGDVQVQPGSGIAVYQVGVGYRGDS
jgi:UDP-N-acetyl-D-mannosaminuronic acid dehydrogenase